MKNLIKFSAIALSMAFVFTSCNDDDDDNDTPQITQQTIAEIASGSDDFTILVDILERTDLVKTLNSPGDFTVFAPTNQAFEDALKTLGFSSVDELENALTTDGLRNVVLYHVINAEVKSADISPGFVDMMATFRTGENLDAYVGVNGSSVSVNSAMVVTPDLDASNGVIHSINEVLLPLDVVELAQLSPDHTTLVNVLINTDSDGNGTAGELVSVLKDLNETYTIFAPTNVAFKAIEATVAGLNDEQVGKVLTYHVLSGANVVSSDVISGSVPTVNGDNITIDASNGGVSITDVNNSTVDVVATDIQGTNGVIHVINGVLVPTL